MNPPDGANARTDAERVESEFIHNWGMLAETFGMHRDLGRAHALIYIAERPVGEQAIADKLGLSAEAARGFAHELLDWGVVRLAESGDAFVTERDPWEFFLRIVGERHRREFIPVLFRMRATLSRARSLSGALPEEDAARHKVEEFSGFIEELSRLIDLFVRLGAKPMALVLKTLAKFAPRA